jgi:hypothetical protein
MSMRKKNVRNQQGKAFDHVFVWFWLGVVLPLEVDLRQRSPAVPWAGMTPAHRPMDRRVQARRTPGDLYHCRDRQLPDVPWSFGPVLRSGPF